MIESRKIADSDSDLDDDYALRVTVYGSRILGGKARPLLADSDKIFSLRSGGHISRRKSLG